MLRITTDDKPQCLTLRLEGRLYGAWVAVLAEAWKSALAGSQGRVLRVDLNEVTFVDADGKARLSEMHAQGAELLGDDIETKALVAEIRAGRSSGGNGEELQVSPPKPVTDLHEQLTDLQRLQAELHEVNEALVRAARPLDRLSELNDQQRHQLADQIRERLARWESVTQQIAQVLGIESANGGGTQRRNEGGSR